MKDYQEWLVAVWIPCYVRDPRAEPSLGFCEGSHADEYEAEQFRLSATG